MPQNRSNPPMPTIQILFYLCASNILANLALLSKADGEKNRPDPRLQPDFAREPPAVVRVYNARVVSYKSFNVYLTNLGVRR